MTERIEATYGYVTFGSSSRKGSESGWFIWPSDTNSLMAAAVGAIYGPFADEEAAKKAAADVWFEFEPDEEAEPVVSKS